MEQLLNSYSNEILKSLKSIQKNLKNYIINETKKDLSCDFTIPQLLLMSELYNNSNITLSELSKKLGLSKSTVSGMIDRLEAKEVVIRERASDNRREVRISLNPKTVEQGNVIKNIATKYLSEILQNVKIEEVENILESLKKLNSLINSRNT